MSEEVTVTIAFRLADGLEHERLAVALSLANLGSQSPFGLLTDWNDWNNTFDHHQLPRESQSPFGLLTDWNRVTDEHRWWVYPGSQSPFGLLTDWNTRTGDHGPGRHVLARHNRLSAC